MAFWWALCRVAALFGVIVAAVPLLALQSQPTARAAPASAPSRGFTWPLIPTPQVLRTFEPPTQRWLPGHRGVDLAATSGATVYSAGDGVVHFAGPVAGKPVVSIRHPDGLLTTYEPVKSSVRAGMPVAHGSPIGVLEPGHEGCARPCLHWGARRGAGTSATYLDPLALLGVVRVRLKPLETGDA
ncbi:MULTISPECIES: M23 family metallopeptidase [Actinomycetes]|uniref:M23 family metallopeptidase n=1 Tax=Actinomycetes TaxID=1760 RepID=UPI0004BEDDA6|nr:MULTISPECIES: M23 family metallopeptidase [Actinomycetes]